MYPCRTNREVGKQMHPPQAQTPSANSPTTRERERERERERDVGGQEGVDAFPSEEFFLFLAIYTVPPFIPKQIFVVFTHAAQLNSFIHATQF